MLRILKYKLCNKVDKGRSRKRGSNNLVKTAFAINRINLNQTLSMPLSSRFLSFHIPSFSIM